MKVRISGKIKRMSDFAAVFDEYQYNNLIPANFKFDFKKATMFVKQTIQNFSVRIVPEEKTIYIENVGIGFKTLQKALDFAKQKQNENNFRIKINCIL